MKILSVWGESIVLRRVVAKFIDSLLVFIPMSIFYPFGSLVGVLYMLFSDMIFGHRSIGKKLMDLTVVSSKQYGPDRYQLALRNLLFAVTFFFFSFPLLGWILFFTVGLFFIAFEIYLMIAQDNHQRLGDIMANTKVVMRKN